MDPLPTVNNGSGVDIEDFCISTISMEPSETGGTDLDVEETTRVVGTNRVKDALWIR